MPAPTVSVYSPPSGVTWPDNLPRLASTVVWTGGAGPFDVLHEWDTDNLFGSPLQDSNTGTTSPDTGTPPADLGPAGTRWYYRATVTDTSDATATTTSTHTIDFVDPIDFDRFLYLLANVGVGFTPTDDPAAGWGPAPDAIGPDGNPIDFDRFLYLLANVGVGFDPTDTPAAGWDPEDVGSPLIGPGDGYTIDFDRFLYLLANIDTTTPTPHIWYVFPDYGREGWEFVIVGYGFGDTQPTFAGIAELNDLAVGIISWALHAESSTDLTIDPTANIAKPIHQEIRATVPTGAVSGVITVTTDGP